MATESPAPQDRTGGTRYIFADFCLNPDGTLLRGTTTVPLPPKELALLRLLLANAGKVVPAQQLRESVWTAVHVSSDSLPRSISSLRNRLDSEDCIQTLYKRGYRFQLPVRQTHIDQWLERRVIGRTEVPRLAILPFLSAEGVPESIGPGIAEETMLRLSRNNSAQIDILARDSVFSCASLQLSAQQTGQRLQAHLVLTGKVSALPLHYRLRAEMVRVEDNTQLWMEDFLVPRELVAYADARLAKRVSARIRASFASPDATAVASIQPSSSHSSASHTPSSNSAIELPSQLANNAEAYTTFLQARFQWNTLERHQMLDAIRGFQRAAELDTSLVSARVHLVHSHLFLATFGYLRGDTAAELALREAEKALSIAPASSSIHDALGWIHFYHRRDLAAAAAAFARAEHAVFKPWVAHYRARFALGRRQFTEAADLLRAAIAIDSYSPWPLSRLAWALHLSGDGAAAIREVRRALNLFPQHPMVLTVGSQILSAWGAPGSELSSLATDIAVQLTQAAPYLDAGYSALAYAYARQGQTVQARALIERQRWHSRERFVMRSLDVPALVELGEYDQALQELSIAEQQHCPWFFELLLDPRLQLLHNHSEFVRLNHIARQIESASESVA